MRPYLKDLLHLLFEELKDHLRVAVWSSMMSHNLHPLVHAAFGEYCKELEFVWDQTCCTQKWVPGMHKPLFRKDLHWLGRTALRAHVPNHVLLVDDDPIKCTHNTPGTAVHPSTFELANWENDDELLKLVAYLEQLVASRRTVPEFVKTHDFSAFTLQRQDPGEKEDEKAARGESPHAKRRRCEQPGVAGQASFRRGAEVEAWWPDDEEWLAATVVEEPAAGEDEVTIMWAEDGSESAVPLEYLRIRKKGGSSTGRNGAHQAQRAATSCSWQRIASRSNPTMSYYYNSVTGESVLEPPPPWSKRPAAGRPGKFEYYNTETGEASAEKPDIA